MTKAPEPLMQDLRDAIRDGIAQGKARIEAKVEVIDAPENPLFIDRPDLTARVLRELHPYAEAWAGVELTPYTAYGLRLYQNQSAVCFGRSGWLLSTRIRHTNNLNPFAFCQLWMHVDKSQTHVVSFILHIDKSEDAEDWPIFIEGKTVAVVWFPLLLEKRQQTEGHWIYFALQISKVTRTR
jgi:hypothetical protein